MTTRTIDATEQRSAMPDLATVTAIAIGGGESATEARATARDRTLTIKESVTSVTSERIRIVESQVKEASDFFEPVTDTAYQATERLHIGCVPKTADQLIATGPKPCLVGPLNRVMAS